MRGGMMWLQILVHVGTGWCGLGLLVNPLCLSIFICTQEIICFNVVMRTELSPEVLLKKQAWSFA